MEYVIETPYLHLCSFMVTVNGVRVVYNQRKLVKSYFVPTVEDVLLLGPN